MITFPSRLFIDSVSTRYACTPSCWGQPMYVIYTLYTHIIVDTIYLTVVQTYMAHLPLLTINTCIQYTAGRKESVEHMDVHGFTPTCRI